MVSLISTVLSYSIGIVKTPTASEVSKILNGQMQMQADIYLLVNCKDPERDTQCKKALQHIEKAMNLIEMENSSHFSEVAKTYKIRQINCFKNPEDRICIRLDFNNTLKSRIRFVSVSGKVKESQIYTYSSPVSADNLRFKIEKILEKDDVTFHEGTYKELVAHPVITKENRTLVVLESQNIHLIKYFKSNAAFFKERYSAFVVSEKDISSAHSNPNYDNCYVVGPNNYTQRYLIPISDNVIHHLAEQEIKKVFLVSSLPRAIVLRKQIIDGDSFIAAFGNRTVYVALIDSGAEDYQAEFGFQYTKWTQQYS